MTRWMKVWIMALLLLAAVYLLAVVLLIAAMRKPSSLVCVPTRLGCVWVPKHEYPARESPHDSTDYTGPYGHP